MHTKLPGPSSGLLRGSDSRREMRPPCGFRANGRRPKIGQRGSPPHPRPATSREPACPRDAAGRAHVAAPLNKILAPILPWILLSPLMPGEAALALPASLPPRRESTTRFHLEGLSRGGRSWTTRPRPVSTCPQRGRRLEATRSNGLTSAAWCRQATKSAFPGCTAGLGPPRRSQA